ncbi:MAG: HEAT repeat domain-containing protein, partial [Candidatus Riflebacteria bacterium]|nr:HEAT repeat domain-containing protein [Candidatus Riflebacteria bacterium]
MKESAYRRISELRVKLATIICEKLNDKFSNESKGKLIHILAKIGISNYYKIIYDYANKNPESCDAIVALSLFDVKETVDYFLEKLKNPRTLHRDLMVECLGNLKKQELVLPIKEYLKDEDRQVRFQAAYALYNIGGREAALAMCEYISDPDEWISM